MAGVGMADNRGYQTQGMGEVRTLPLGRIRNAGCPSTSKKSTVQGNCSGQIGDGRNRPHRATRPAASPSGLDGVGRCCAIAGFTQAQEYRQPDR